jgi:predicted nucleotidyltransferase
MTIRKTGLAILQSRRAELLALADKYGVKNIRVFGSVARGEEDADSDIDLLVTPLPKTSLFEFMDMEEELQALLGRKIDLVSDGGLSPYLKDRILTEAKPI